MKRVKSNLKYTESKLVKEDHGKRYHTERYNTKGHHAKRQHEKRHHAKRHHPNRHHAKRQKGRMQKVTGSTEKGKKIKRHLAKELNSGFLLGTPHRELKIAANRQETVSSLLNQAMRLLSNDKGNTNQQRENREPSLQSTPGKVTIFYFNL